MIKILTLCAIFLVGDLDFSDPNTVPEITKKVQKNTEDIKVIKNDIEDIKQQLDTKPSLGNSIEQPIEHPIERISLVSSVESRGWGQPTLSVNNGSKGSTSTSFSTQPVLSQGWGQPTLSVNNGSKGSTQTSFSTQPMTSILSQPIEVIERPVTITRQPVRIIQQPVRSPIIPVRNIPIIRPVRGQRIQICDG